MKGLRSIAGCLVAFIGWLLSPATWWNDAFINIPIAWFFASILEGIFPGSFKFSIFIFYWLTNFLGVVLVGIGSSLVLNKKGAQFWVLSLLITTAYTVLMGILMFFNILRPIRF
jgi:hypothetical protein